MRQAVIYLRVSTIEQTTANQERELREIASRMGCEIVKVYRDHGISGAKGRDKRPAFDKLCRDAARREFDMVMAWSVDQLGRSLQDLNAQFRRDVSTWGAGVFPHGVIPGSSHTPALGISSPGIDEAHLKGPCNHGEPQWNTMSDWTYR